MKIKRIYISTTMPELNDAIIEVEGVGEITIKASLPSEIQEQVEDFYRGLLRERLNAQAFGTL